MSKAFNKVWCDGLIYKLKTMVFWEICYHRVVLNGQCSDWQGIKAGILQ